MIGLVQNLYPARLPQYLIKRTGLWMNNSWALGNHLSDMFTLDISTASLIGLCVFAVMATSVAFSLLVVRRGKRLATRVASVKESLDSILEFVKYITQYINYFKNFLRAFNSRCAKIRLFLMTLGIFTMEMLYYIWSLPVYLVQAIFLAKARSEISIFLFRTYKSIFKAETTLAALFGDFIKSPYFESTWDQIENVILYSLQLRSCRSKSEVLLASMVFAKLVSKKSLAFSVGRTYSAISDYLRSNLGYSQSDLDSVDPFNSDSDSINTAQFGLESFSNMLDGASNTLGTANDFMASHTKKAIARISMFALVSGVAARSGLTLDSVGYSKLEAMAIRRKFRPGPELVLDLLNSVVHVLRRLVNYIKTGKISSFIVSESSVQDFYTNYTSIMEKKLSYMAGMETDHNYLTLIKDTIDLGDNLVTTLYERQPSDAKLVRSYLTTLKVLQTEVLLKKEAAKHRTPPMGVEIFGKSSVGKSSVMQHLARFYAANAGIDKEKYADGIYTRNAAANFADNFKSSHWCYVVDDAACLNPKKQSEGDVALKELLHIINSVPYVLDQASIEDKGLAAVRCKLVMVSTNVKLLAAPETFAEPEALFRRFRYYLTVKVKPEFAKSNGMLEPTKMDGNRDAWLVSAQVYKPGQRPFDIPDAENAHAGHLVYDTFADGTPIKDVPLFTFIAKEGGFVDAVKAHESRTKKEATNIREIQTADICKHNMYMSMCEECELTAQSDQSSIEEKVGMSSQEIIDLCSVDRCRSLVKRVRFSTRIRQTPLFHGLLEKANSIPWPEYYQDVAKEWNVSNGNYNCYIAFVISFIMFIIGSKVVFQKVYQMAQGGIYSHLTATEDKNVWRVDNFIHEPLPSSNTIHNYEERIKNQTAAAFIHRRGKDKRTITNILNVRGSVWIAPAHAFKDAYKIDVYLRDKKQQVTMNVNGLPLDESNMKFLQGKDIVALNLTGAFKGRDLIGLFPKNDDPTVGSCSLIFRDYEHGEVKKIDCGVCYATDFRYSDGEDTYFVKSGYGYAPEIPTFSGLCGAPLVLYHGKHLCITGIHTAGVNDVKSGSARVITRGEINHLIKSFGTFTPIFPDNGTFDVGGAVKDISVSDLHHKSPILYFTDGVARVYGKIDMPRVTRSSGVSRTSIADSVEKHIGTYDSTFTQKYGPPVMRGWKPFRIALDDQLHPKDALKPALLEKVATAFYGDIIEKIGEIDLPVAPLDMATNVNGAAGIRFVDKIVRTTSAGFPHKGKKLTHMKEVFSTEDAPDGMKFTEEIMKQYNLFKNKAKSGERTGAIFQSHLKDEPVSFKKMNSGKTRVFTGATTAFTLLEREYFLPIVKVLMENPFAYEGAIGVNPYGSQWGAFYHYLTNAGKWKSNMIAGDYKSFDKQMSASVISLAFKILIELNRHYGGNNFSKEDFTIMKVISADVSNPRINFDGDLIEFSGSNPSGHSLTTIINSLANSIYMRYCFLVLSERNDSGVTIDNFQKYVHLLTYGDDNCMGVDPSIPWFNHTSISELLAEYDMVYTMADKEAESRPFIPINEVSFLKRRWLYEGGYWLCPLELDSIAKSLITAVKSKVITDQEHSIEVLRNAVRELCLHGRVVYGEIGDRLRKVIAEQGLSASVKVPSWDVAYQLVTGKKSVKDVHVDASDEVLTAQAGDETEEAESIIRLIDTIMIKCLGTYTATNDTIHMYAKIYRFSFMTGMPQPGYYNSVANLRQYLMNRMINHFLIVCFFVFFTIIYLNIRNGDIWTFLNSIWFSVFYGYVLYLLTLLVPRFVYRPRYSMNRRINASDFAIFDIVGMFNTLYKISLCYSVFLLIWVATPSSSTILEE